MTDSREILSSFYDHPYTRQAVESAAKRLGVPCRVVDNPLDGVVVVQLDPNGGTPIVVELNEGEKTLLLVALGKAFAKLVRL